MTQTINGIIIDDIIKNDIYKLAKYDPKFTTYNLFCVLEMYLSPCQIMKLLGIGRNSYYRYKKEKVYKFVDRKLYEFYLSLDFQDLN